MTPKQIAFRISRHDSFVGTFRAIVLTIFISAPCVRLSAQPAAAPIVESASPPEIVALLRAEGFSNARADQDGDVLVSMGSQVVVISVAEDRRSLRIAAAWKTSPSSRVSLDQINQWNKTRRFSRAFLDADNDPHLTVELELTGGVTKARILDFLTNTARLSISRFASEVVR